MTTLPEALDAYVEAHDFSVHTVKAIRCDLQKFAAWFSAANDERFELHRITVRDVADFRDHLAHVRRQAVATVNRALVSIRRFLDHLVRTGMLDHNPATAVKELRRMPAAPRGLTTAQVRRILREIELRQDHRAGGLIGLMTFAGLRVSDVVGLELPDALLQHRSGSVTCRRGKGNKQRTVPLSREARRLLAAYLEVRPAIASERLFVGERGPLTDDGVRAVCQKYAAICGVSFTPHNLRHTFARQYLEQSANDLTGLAQILGHESLQTTSIYVRQSDAQLQGRVEDLRFE
jgi:site-specific recombinase XerD